MPNIGDYVEYKAKPYILCSVRANGMYLLLNPLSGNKLQVGAKSVQGLNYSPCTKAHYKGRDYLVTGKGYIISLTSNKVMKWSAESPTRLSILELAA